MQCIRSEREREARELLFAILSSIVWLQEEVLIVNAFHWLKSRHQSTSQRKRHFIRPFVELMEERTVPSVTIGPNVNVTQLAGNQAESTISINPTNPLNLFECDTLSNIGHYSTDGGQTWATSNMSALPLSIGDVQTAWDSFGNLFITRLTQNKTVMVARSSDGGATFKDPRAVGDFASDQPAIAVGAGSVWVAFTDNHDQYVAAGAAVTSFDSVGTFGALELVAPGGDFGDVAVGPNGQVLVVYQNLASGQGPDDIQASLDPDGLGPLGFQASVIASSTNVGSFDAIPAQPSRSIDAEANLAWDRSGGPHNGRVYLVYTDENVNESNDTNIMVRYSDDNGASWSAPVQANDDATTRSQFLPAIALDQTTGDVGVTWYDARNSATNTTVQIFGAVSTDGGASFTANFQISAGTTDGTLPATGTFNLGDYDKMDFNNGVLYRGWADNSSSVNGTLDIYTAKVTVTTDPTAPAVTAPANQTAIEAFAQSFNLGSFFDPDGGPWTVDVNWGDNSPHTVFTAATSGSLGIRTHTFVEDGAYNVTVTVTDSTNRAASATYQVSAAEPAITVSAPITAKGKKVNNDVVATFVHGVGAEPASAFLATIDWGDGTSSAGIITKSGSTYTVNGTHTYAKGGKHTVTTTVTEIGEVGALTALNAATFEDIIVNGQFATPARKRI